MFTEARPNADQRKSHYPTRECVLWSISVGSNQGKWALEGLKFQPEEECSKDKLLFWFCWVWKADLWLVPVTLLFLVLPPSGKNVVRNKLSPDSNVPLWKMFKQNINVLCYMRCVCQQLPVHHKIPNNYRKQTKGSVLKINETSSSAALAAN